MIVMGSWIFDSFSMLQPVRFIVHYDVQIVPELANGKHQALL